VRMTTRLIKREATLYRSRVTKALVAVRCEGWCM
jgi:hypothetical protein